MKLENNSLKYGMNSANNANNAFSNAYNQEMANQRDMQGQVTQRQKTLLEAATQEANDKQQERDRIYGYNPQKGTFTKVYDPANPNAYDLAVNTAIENSIRSETVYYNDSVEKFNNLVEQFPGNIVAAFFPKFKVKPTFKAEAGAEKAPSVFSE